jgi:hypothetical protein
MTGFGLLIVFVILAVSAVLVVKSFSKNSKRSSNVVEEITDRREGVTESDDVE